MTVKKNSIARIDPPLLMSSVFRADEGLAVSAGHQKAALNVKFDFDGAVLTFVCFQRPGAFEQRILLSLVAAAHDEYLPLDAGATTDIGKDLWTKLVAKDAAQRDSAVVVSTNYRRLLDAAGLSDGSDNYRHLKDSLFMLSNVACRVQKDGYDWSMHLLSFSSAPDGSIKVALNGRLAAAILGGQFAGVCMKSYLALESDLDRLLYAWLCSFSGPKSTHKIKLDSLSEKVFVGGNISADALRKRRSRVKLALDHIDGFASWSIKVEGRGSDAVAVIQRFRL